MYAAGQAVTMTDNRVSHDWRQRVTDRGQEYKKDCCIIKCNSHVHLSTATYFFSLILLM